MTDIDRDRFVGHVDTSFFCPICLGVLQDPVYDCKYHMFCRKCITQWVRVNHTCPLDRSRLYYFELKTAEPYFTSLIHGLQVTCDNKDAGCNAILRLDNLAAHIKACSFNQKVLVKCEKGCELMFERQKINTHDCVAELKRERDELQKKYDNMAERLNELEKNAEARSEQLASNTTHLNQQDMALTVEYELSSDDDSLASRTQSNENYHGRMNLFSRFSENIRHRIALRSHILNEIPAPSLDTRTFPRRYIVARRRLHSSSNSNSRSTNYY